MSEPHAHSHAHGPATFDRAFAIGILLNLTFVAVEAFFGWKVNSLALLADAGHNLSDVAGLALAWGGALVSRLSPSPRKTYGWRRGSILAAFANAVILLVAMGSLGWEALERFHTPAPTQGTTIIAVAAVGIVINTITALLFLRGSHGDLNIRGAFLHMAADALVSAGVVVAGILTITFGWTWIDPLASLLIAAVIVIGTWGLFRQSLHLLFDGVPEQIDFAAVRRYLKSLPGVERVHDLHVWAMGTSEVALTAHLVMPEGYPTDSFFQTAAKELHDQFHIEHVTIQVVSSPYNDPCLPHDAGLEVDEVPADPRGERRDVSPPVG